MSFILDALKKSEAERQRQAGPALLEMRIVRPARRLPVWAVIVGVALVICVMILAWVALRRTAAPAAPASTAAAPQATAPAAGSTGTAGVAVQQATGPAATVLPAAAAPLPGAAPLTSAGAESQNSAGDDNPADVAPAEAAPASASPSHSGTAGLRNYAELGGKLPELRLDLHVYAAKSADRYAFINMHKVREGEVTSEGVQVKEITPDGVVLEYQGTEFLLGRQ